MPINVPAKLQEIYEREYLDMYSFGLSSIVDDSSGYIYDTNKGQIENTFLLTSETVRGAMPFVPDALKGPIQELLRVKEEIINRCFIRDTEPDYEQKRYESILSRIATFSGSEKEKSVAVAELTRLGKPVSYDLMKLAHIDEILPVLIGQIDPRNIHIDDVSKALKSTGVDITPLLPLIGMKAPDRIIYDGAPISTARYPITNINRPMISSEITQEEKAQIATLDQSDGLFQKTFGTQLSNLPDGVDIFDTIFVDGQRFSERYASSVQGYNRSNRYDTFKAIFANSLFSGTSKIEFCPIDKDYNVGEPIRVSAGKNVFVQDPPRPMGAIRRFFVRMGFYKEYVNRDIRQDKLFNESAKNKTARHSAIKQKLAAKGAEAKQAKEAAVEAEYTTLLQKAKTAQLNHSKSITAQYNQFFKKEDLPILEGANDKMGLQTIGRQVSALSFARIALMAKGHPISDILSPDALQNEKAAIGRELIDKIKTGDKAYFQNMFKEAALKLKDMAIPQFISTREDLIKGYSTLKSLQALSVDFQQIIAPSPIADYEAKLTPKEQEEFTKNTNKLSAIAKITSSYTDALIEAEDNPSPMTIINSAVKATIALNLPLQTNVLHMSTRLQEVDIPDGYKSIGDKTTMQIAQMPEEKRNKIVNDCVAFAKSDRNKSPITIDGEFMPIIKETRQRVTLFAEPHTEAPAQERRRVSLDLDSTKKRTLSADPKTTTAPQAEITQPKV